MYKEIPTELKDALKAFEIGALDKVIERKRREDFEALRRLLSLDTAVDPGDRQRAVYALGRWGDPDVVPEILALPPELKESQCITAIEALGRLGTKAAREAVASYAGHPSPQIRKFVVQALTRIGDAAARATLRKIAKEDRQAWVRELASKRIKMISAKTAAKKVS